MLSGNKKGIGAILIASALTNIIMPVVLIIAMMAPLGWAYMIATEVWDGIQDGGLKISTNIKTTMNGWFAEDETAANAQSYEEYLLNRFMQLNKKVGDGNGNETMDKQNVAVSWVYTKVYSSYLELNAAGKVKHFFGWDGKKPSPYTYAYKDLAYTAQNVYSPQKEKPVAEARKESSFEDDINVYDIMAFDWVAGTLFDVLNLDLVAARNEVYLERKEDIDKEIGDKVRGLYKEGIVDVLKEINTSILEFYKTGDGTPSSVLASKGVSMTSPPGATGLEKLVNRLKKNGYSNNDSSSSYYIVDALYKANLASIDYNAIAESLLKKYEENHAKLIEEQKKEDAISKASWDKRQAELEAEFNANEENKDKEFTKEEYKPRQYKPKYDAQRDVLDDVIKFKELALSVASYYPIELANAWDAKNPVKREYDDKGNLKPSSITLTELVENSVLEVKKKGSENIDDVGKKALNKASKEKDSLTSHITDALLRSNLDTKIKNLKLKRTQLATETYKDALVDSDVVASIKYRILNSGSIKELDKLREQKRFEGIEPVYNKDGSTSVNILVSDKKVTTEDNKSHDDAYDRDIYNIVSKTMILDNDGRPIVSGKDVKTGVEYFEGKYTEYFNAVKEAIDVASTDVEALKMHPDNIAKNNIFVDSLKSSVAKQASYGIGSIMANPLFNNQEESVKKTISEAHTNITDGKLGDGINNFINLYDTGAYKLELTQNAMDNQHVLSWNNYFSETIKHVVLYKNISISMDEINSGAKKCYTQTTIADIAKTVNDKLSIELKWLSELRGTINGYIDKGITDDMLSNADITNIRVNGKGQDTDNDFYNSNDKSTLLVKEFKNTREEAVKIVARKHYNDILTLYRQQGGGGSGDPINVGDLEIGTWTVPGAPNYGSYERAASFLHITKRICEENNMDPYLITAMIATESSGNMDSGRENIAKGKGAVGLTQIEHVHWNKTVTMPGTKESITLDPYKILSDPELAIKAGVWQTAERMKNYEGNVLMSIVGYNMGQYAMERILFLKLVDDGVVSLSDWSHKGALGDNPSAHAKVYPHIKEYMRSNDADWLNFRQAYQEEAWFGSAVGTLNHLEKVLAYYNTTDGMPWGYNWDTGEKVYIVQGEANMGEDENGNKIKHNKNKELVLWKEYYTETKKFEDALKWSKENNKDSIFSKEFDVLVQESISKIVGTKENDREIVALGLSKSVMENLVAGAINLDNGFKITAKNDTDIDNYVKSKVADILNSFKAVDGKDKYFAMYHYVSVDKDMAKYDIQFAPKDFREFYEEKNKQEATTTQSTSVVFMKVAQIINGSLDVNFNDFYKKTEKPTGVAALSPENRFFKEWLDGKAALHEIYNAVSDEREADGSRKWDELKAPKELENVDKDGKPKDKELIGTITVSNKNGTPTKQDVPLRDKPLENNVDKEASRKNEEIKYIVIHESDLTTNELHRKYDAKEQKSSMNYVVDSTTAYRFAEDKFVANHLPDKTSAHTSVQTNLNSIGIEISKVASTSRERTLWNTIALTKHIMKKYSILPENVVLHRDVTGIETCTQIMSENSKIDGKTNWDVFKDAIKDKDVTVEYAPNQAEATGKFIRPTVGVLTSPYGPRVHPISGSSSFHTGIDLADPSGPPIVASDAGVVVKKSSDGGYGNHVIVDHGDGLVSLYAHMRSVDVSVGDSLAQGDKIGIMGTTGSSTGVHLHFEIRKDNIHTDPLKWITL